MRKQSVRANQSLLRNGDFAQDLKDWTRGPVNPNRLSVEQLSHNGLPINVLSTAHGSSVSQEFVVPKDPSANATYVLKFLCESWHTESAQVSIKGEGWPPFEIEIPPGTQLKGGQPLDYVPLPYEIPLDLPIHSGDTLTFSVTSPMGAANNLVLFFADFVLELRLAPLVLEALTLDEQSHSPTAPLPLCLGVDGTESHELGFDIVTDNAWLATQGSLVIDGNPLGSILANPDWEVDQPLNLPWLLQCPLVDDSQPHLLTLWLWNQYFADPFPVEVSLWHHRLEFGDVEEAKHFPVVDEGESVRLGVQVTSYYTKRALEGHVVTWTQKGQGVLRTAVTNADGWAFCEVTPAVAGTLTVEASVVSRYYTAGVVTRDFSVRAEATSPWKQVMALVAGVPTPWQEKRGYPNRGSNYLVRVQLPSIFTGTGVTLHWRGTSHTQLRVEVSPPLDEEVAVPADLEMLWSLSSADDLDGDFKLWLSCSKLLKPSPEKDMRLARNEVEVGDKREADRTPVVDEQERALMQVQVVHLVASGNGDPVRNASVVFEEPDGSTTSTVTGDGGWASKWFDPLSAGDHVVSAYIKAHADALPIKVDFAVKAIATSRWNKEVRFLLDDKEVDRKTVGLLCRRGETHTLRVVPVTDSLWVGRSISVHWRNANPLIGLEISDLGAPKILLETGVEWTFSSEEATSTSSMFEVELRLADEPIVRELSGRLMFEDYAKELSLLLDQVPAQVNGQSFYPCLAARHGFIVLPHALSPLLGLMLSVAWTGTPAPDLNAEMRPPPGTLQPVSAGGVVNELDFTASAQPGLFNLKVSVPQLAYDATATPMVLDHNKVRIEKLREAAVDPVLGMDKAWIGALIVSNFTGQPVVDAPVEWTAEGKSTEHKTDARGWSIVGYEPTVGGSQTVGVFAVSPHDNFKDSRETVVEVLRSDPWDGVRAHFDGQPGQPLGTQTLFPRSETQHLLEVTADVGSALKGRSLALGMSLAGPVARGIEFDPKNTLGKSQLFTEVLQFPFTVGNTGDGSCRLRLAAERVARLSPEINMSVGAGSKVWKISATTRTAPTLYWGELFTAEVKVISSISKSAMVGVDVEFQGENGVTFTAVTNFYGVAKYSFVPTVPGMRGVTAKVGDGEFSDNVKLPYILLAPREIESLTSPNTSGPIGARVAADILMVSALDGQPLERVEIIWSFLDLLIPPSITDADGKAHVEFRLPGMNRALLEATVKGGVAGWVGQHIEFRVVPNE